VTNTRTAKVVGPVTTGILTLGTVGIIMASPVASDTTPYEGEAAGQSGPAPVAARTLARGVGTDMFMV
jgi:hypothetical protein